MAKLTKYKAPDGYVYDYAEPKIIDGVEQHLYAKYLNICHFDDIENYKLVEDNNVRNN